MNQLDEQKELANKYCKFMETIGPKLLELCTYTVEKASKLSQPGPKLTFMSLMTFQAVLMSVILDGVEFKKLVKEWETHGKCAHNLTLKILTQCLVALEFKRQGIEFHWGQPLPTSEISHSE